MLLYTVLLLCLATTTLCQDDVGECALSCIANVSGTSCNQAQWSCLCQSENYLTRTSECARTACNGADYDTAISAIKQLCAIFQASLTLQPYATASISSSEILFSTVNVPFPSSLPSALTSSTAIQSSASSNPSTNSNTATPVRTTQPASVGSQTSITSTPSLSVSASGAASPTSNNGRQLVEKDLICHVVAGVCAALAICS